MLFHQIIVPYRNRPKSLYTLLETLPVSRHLQIVLVDLGSSTSDTEAIFEKSRHNIQHHWIDYTGTFQRSKAMNYGLDNSESEWITIWDVDCLFRTDPLPSIEKFCVPENRHKKMSWRLHPIDPPISKRIQNNPEVFKGLDFSRYPNHVSERFDCITTGTSHFTIHRQTLIDIGGFDERFIGYGMEDHELNLRLAKAGIETEINLECPLYHLSHPYETDWRSAESDASTAYQFMENRKAGFPPLQIGPTWGKF